MYSVPKNQYFFVFFLIFQHIFKLWVYIFLFYQKVNFKTKKIIAMWTLFDDFSKKELIRYSPIIDYRFWHFNLRHLSSGWLSHSTIRRLKGLSFATLCGKLFPFQEFPVSILSSHRDIELSHNNDYFSYVISIGLSLFLLIALDVL